jgi:tRNA C32,U32 (ribose-2'-O)-methylase TrmJ
MHDIVGFSMRAGVNPPHWMDLPRWVGELVAVTSAPQGRTALVFGPEENGLTTAHLEHCRRIVRIPSAAACPSFNLAQSVLLVLYELTRQEALTPRPPLPIMGEGESETPILVSLPAQKQTTPDPDSPFTRLPLAQFWERGAGGEGQSPQASNNAPLSTLPTRADLAPLERLLDTVMRESGFVRPGSPATVPGVVRNLFRRLQMDRHELGVLMGLFGRLQTTIRRSQPEPADITLSQEHR